MAATFINQKLWDRALEKVPLEPNNAGATDSDKPGKDAVGNKSKNKPEYLIVSVKKPPRLSMERSKPMVLFNLEVLRLMLMQIVVPVIYAGLRIFLVALLGSCTFSISFNMEDKIEIGYYGSLAFVTLACYVVYKRAGAKEKAPARWIKICCQLIQVLGFLLAMKLTWDGVFGSELAFGDTCLSGSSATIVHVVKTLIVFYYGLIGIAFIILTM